MKHFQIPLISAVIFLTVAGCVSKEQFYDDVTLSRESAYKQWENRKQVEKQTQVVISGKLSLEDSIKLTLTNNKQLLRTLEEREAARGEEVGSYSAMAPSVGLKADYHRVNKIMDLGGIPMGALDNYSTGLEVTQPLFAGGAIPARINAGRLGALMADQAVRTAVQNTVYSAQTGYYQALLNRHLYAIADEAVKSAQAHLNDVNQKRTAGVASDYDVLRSQVDLSNYTAKLIQSRNAIHVSRASLIKIMGISQDSTFELSDELVYSPFEITMEQAVSKAYQNRPDLFTRELTIKQQKELLTIAQSGYYPQINAYYNYNYAKPDPVNPMINKWDNSWSYGAAASWPLFDGFAREGNVIQQKARLKQSQIDLIDTEETALYEITSAMLSIQDAAEFAESQKFNLTRAAEALRLVQIGYREGINTQVEIVDAQSALTEARANYYQAIYSHLVAKLNLQKAMGTLSGIEIKQAGE
jgi:outer membrane protein